MTVLPTNGRCVRAVFHVVFVFPVPLNDDGRVFENHSTSKEIKKT